MSLSEPLAPVVLGIAVVAGLLAVAVAVLALRLRRLARDQRRALDGVDVDVVATLARLRRRLDELDGAVDGVRIHSEGVAADVSRTLSRVGVVRYDAYDDIGGQQSFSAAILDGHGDGVVLTSITGRTDGRTYLKSITAGAAAVVLSDEESAAVTAAGEQPRSEQIAEAGKRAWRQR